MSTYIILLLLLATAAIVIFTLNKKNTASRTEKPKPNLPKPNIPAKDEISHPNPVKTPQAKPSETTPVKVPKPKPSTDPLLYADRKGYDAQFIKTDDFKIELDDLLKNLQGKLTVLKNPQAGNQHLLNYHHFSVAMNNERNMPIIAAVNIDGSKSIENPRVSDKWIYDPRLDKAQQLGKEYYKGNNLDLGHLVRRLDPVWGDVALAADADTFHLTVCAPQHKKLNRVTWLSLEDFILKNTDIEDLKVSVFTGPVFTEHDFAYRNALLPLQFWKMAALIKKDGTPSVTAYLLSHEDYLSDMGERELIGEDGFGAYKTYQIPLSQLEEMTNLNLENVKKYDPLAHTRSINAINYTEIGGASSIQL